MDLQQRIRENLKDSLRKRDQTRLSTLRLVIAAICNAEIAKGKKLEDTDVLGVIAREVKQRKESIEAFSKGNRADLVAKEQAEMAVLLSYLPQQLSRDEIIEVAKRIISEVGAAGLKDKGKVMPRIISELKGKAEGGQINTIVSELLGS